MPSTAMRPATTTAATVTRSPVTNSSIITCPPREPAAATSNAQAGSVPGATYTTPSPPTPSTGFSRQGTGATSTARGSDAGAVQGAGTPAAASRPMVARRSPSTAAADGDTVGSPSA